MPALKIGIVEDEMIIGERIRTTLMQLGYDVTEVVGTYTEAIEMIQSENPDLLLLDIQLGGEKDGIDLAYEVRERFQLPFIFLTANSDPATLARAKEVEPPAYLVKPFNKDDLFASIEIAFHNFSKLRAERKRLKEVQDNYFLKNALFIKQGTYFHKVPFTDIRYVMSEHVYLTIHTSRQNYTVRDTLNDYALNFDPTVFFRCHRRFLVNLDMVERINSLTILVSGIDIPITKERREELLNRLRLG